MSQPQHSKNFWLGNAILAVAMVVLLFMGRLWEAMGPMAMGLWVALVGGGVYLLMGEKGGPASPD